MITKMIVKNFKVLEDFEVEFSPFTALIGANSCGKSTVLQALDFIRSFATRDIDEYLKERDWAFQDLKSQFGSSRKSIYFDTLHSFVIGEESIVIEWCFSINYVERKWHVDESIKNAQTGEALLDPSIFALMDTQSSCLKFITAEMGSKYKFHPAVFALKGFMENSSSFELLSPDVMRKHGGRGTVTDIGIGGETLSAFINRLNTSQKEQLDMFVTDFVGYPVEVKTESRGRPGGIELSIKEKFNKNHTKNKPSHISDDLMRIMAYAAISVQDMAKQTNQYSLYDMENTNNPGGLMLLDEIEDGFNHYHVENLVKILKKIVEESNRQIIVTTHSPVLLNYADPSEIVFMWRRGDGNVQSKPLFSTNEMKDTLDSFNPGEVWLNYDRDELLELLNPSQKEGIE